MNNLKRLFLFQYPIIMSFICFLYMQAYIRHFENGEYVAAIMSAVVSILSMVAIYFHMNKLIGDD